MQIGEILSEMQIDHRLIGDGNFDTLGLMVSNTDGRICSFAENTKYLSGRSKNVSLILAKDNFIRNPGATDGLNLCIVDEPRNTFFKLHNFLSNNEEYRKPLTETVIGTGCNISDMAYIAKKGVVIGNNVTIEEFVSIKENVTIGDNVYIRAGSVIGGEGFEFKREANSIFDVVHLGAVKIENNVEIQQNACIDKAIYPWDSTVIGEYSKIDNLVHIAHGVKVGKCVMIVANSGIGGRVEIGDDAWIGFGATIRNGIKIGNSARVNMGAVVTVSVEDNDAVSGNFAIEHLKFIRHIKNMIG